METKYTKLEDHIDEPIKRSVALMNLYGVETLFSCCGYDYKNPKVPKSHIAGRPQILFKANTQNLKKITNLIHYDVFLNNNSWWVLVMPTSTREPIVKAMMGCKIDSHSSNIDSWNDSNSPHFHEGFNSIFYQLEDRLLQFKNEMKDEVIVKDYNTIMKEVYPSWEYEPCEDWIVKKKDYV